MFARFLLFFPARCASWLAHSVGRAKKSISSVTLARMHLSLSLVLCISHETEIRKISHVLHVELLCSSVLTAAAAVPIVLCAFCISF
jgi:hypothetical protein